MGQQLIKDKQIGNVNASKIKGVLDLTSIPDFDASKIISGTFDAARIPNLDTSKITTGTFDAARIPNLDTSKITTGTFDDARIASSNVTQWVGSIDHDSLLNFVSNEHINHASVSISAGAGLTGGGTINANRTLNVVAANSSITVNADNISHGNTSSQSSVNNSGNTFIQDITLDTYGHVTALGSGTVSGAGSGFGSGQTWSSTVGGGITRVAGTTYHNTTGRVIMVVVTHTGAMTLKTGTSSPPGTTVAGNSGSGGSYSAIINSGEYYQVTTGFTTWSELR